MNIIFTVSGYWPSSGGVQIVTQYMAEELSNRGHNVTVFTSCIEGHEREEEHNNVKIVRFREKDILKIHTGEKKAFQKNLLQRAGQIDALVTVCAQSFASEWAWSIQDKLNCKKVLYMHGMRDTKIHISRIHGVKQFCKDLLLTTWWGIYFKMYWKYIIKYDACVHLFKNDNSYSYFRKNGYKKNYVINNSCDDRFFESDMKKGILEKYQINHEYYICVANFDDNKNQMMALDAFNEAEVDNKQLVFIGSRGTDYSKKLMSAIEKNSFLKEKIKVLVGIPREDTIELVKMAYTCLLTSKSEYFPLTIVEAMAAGKPFISTNVGIVPMLPGGEIGHNKTELAYWIKYYSDNSEYVSSMGLLAKQYAINELRQCDKVSQLESILRY